MTDKNSKDKLPPRAFSQFHLEADRCSAGMCMTLSGVVALTELSDESVTLKSHGGCVNVRGKRLKICVFENKTVEIKGKVAEVAFVYGKG